LELRGLADRLARVEDHMIVERPAHAELLEMMLDRPGIGDPLHLVREVVARDRVGDRERWALTSRYRRGELELDLGLGPEEIRGGGGREDDTGRGTDGEVLAPFPALLRRQLSQLLPTNLLRAAAGDCAPVLDLGG